MNVKNVNQMGFAGSWYSSSENELIELFNQFAKTVKKRNYKAKGAILPHAGHFFSGYGISHFFCNVSQKAKRLILLAPSHYKRLPNNHIFLSKFSEHETPFGNIEGELLESASTIFRLDSEAVSLEHSAEMFYPFIKHYLPNVKLMVFIVPEIDSNQKLVEISDILTKTINYNPEEDLIVASSDFTHYGPRFGYTPFDSGIDQQIEDKVKELDNKYANLLALGKTQTIYKNIEVDHPTICGIYPAMLAATIMSHAGLSGDFVNYYNSNQITAPTSSFVCYASILFH